MQALPNDGESIMISEFPVFDEKLVFPEAESKMNVIMDAIKGIRNRRNEMNVPPSKKTKLYIVTDAPEIFEAGRIFFEKLASASEVVISADKAGVPENAVSVVVGKAELFMPVDELVDKAFNGNVVDMFAAFLQDRKLTKEEYQRYKKYHLEHFQDLHSNQLLLILCNP